MEVCQFCEIHNIYKTLTSCLSQGQAKSGFLFSSVASAGIISVLGFGSFKPLAP